MWGLGKLKDTSLSKLKELAADVVAPRYEDDPDSHVRRRKKDDDGDDAGTRTAYSHGRSTPTASNEPTPVRGSRADIAGGRPASVQSTPAGVAHGTSTAVADVSVNALRERIRVLEAENADVRLQTNQYAVEVRRAHDETVEYYSQQISEREKSIQRLQHDLAALRESNNQAKPDGSASTPAAAEVQRERRRIEELVVRSEALSEQLKEATDACESHRAAFVREQQSLEALKKVMGERIEAMEADSAAKLAAKDSRISDLAAEVAGLNQRIDVLLQHTATEANVASRDIGDKHVAQQSNDKVDSEDYSQVLLEGQLMESKKELTRLTQRLEELSNARADVEQQARIALGTIAEERARDAQMWSMTEIELRSQITQSHLDREHLLEHIKSLELASSSSAAGPTVPSAEVAEEWMNKLREQEEASRGELELERKRGLELQQHVSSSQEKIRLMEMALHAREDELSHAQAELLAQRSQAAGEDAGRQETEQLRTLVAALKQSLSEQAASHEEHARRQEAELQKYTVLHKEQLEKACQLAVDNQTLRRSLEVEKSKADHDHTNIAALTNIKTDLEAECHRYRELSQQLHRTCVDALTKCSVQMPPGKSSPTFSDCVAILCAELQRYSTAIRDAQHVQQQWEHTYEQAREVNASLNAQLQDAWKSIGELREDISVKEQTIARLAQQVKTESTRWQELHVGMSTTSTDIARLQEEKKSLQEQCQQLRSNARDLDERLQSAAGEADNLRRQLDDRDEEVATQRQSVENLQHVLEAFQRGKEEEIQQQCSYLQHDVDTMKERMLSLEGLREAHADELAAAERKYRKEIASKNALVSSLQAKQQELRRMLEEAATQLRDEHMIDKRVVSHLLVNYVHSVAGQRGDEEDIVKVMSGLLNWDGDMQERAGLIPGPLNPKRKIATSTRALVGGLVKTLWGNPGKHIADTAAASAGAEGSGEPNSSDATAGRGGEDAAPKSVAELWVNFLIKEGESARVESEKGQS